MKRECVVKLCTDIKEWLINVRRDLHKTPELSTQEYITKIKIVKYLNEIGIDYIEFEKHYGVMAYILNKNAKKTIAIRADIDGLPINELNDTEYKSVNKGKMHACGHDAHTAILLGACKVLYGIRDMLNVNVKFLFQPAEEDMGGARFLIKDKCLESPKVDYIFGLHVQPHIDTSFIETKYNTLNASADTIKITIKGKQSHGAYPDEGVDAIVAASQVVVGLQSIISRNISPCNLAVLTIGKIKGGYAQNIICENVELNGTLRALNKQTRNFMIKRIEEIVEKISQAFGCTGELEIESGGYPPVINDKNAVDIVIESVKTLFGKDKLIMRQNPSLGGEDFSFYTENCKGAFFHLGCKNESKNIVHPLHTAKFDIDEDCLPIGVMMHVMNVLYFQ